MNKDAVILHVARTTGLSKKDSGRAVEAVLDAIQHGMRTEGIVQFVGFGTFALKETKAREGVNPATGRPINIPAVYRPVFRPGKKLTDMVGGDEQAPAK